MYTLQVGHFWQSLNIGLLSLSQHTYTGEEFIPLLLKSCHLCWSRWWLACLQACRVTYDPQSSLTKRHAHVRPTEFEVFIPYKAAESGCTFWTHIEQWDCNRSRCSANELKSWPGSGTAGEIFHWRGRLNMVTTAQFWMLKNNASFCVIC